MPYTDSVAAPACPACTRELDPGRTLQGQFDGAPLPGPLIACSGCLAVVAMEPIAILSSADAEVPYETDEPVEYEPKVRILGASIARALDSLRRPDALVPAYETIVSDPALSLALRVPEVFAIAKSALRGGAVCARTRARHAFLPGATAGVGRGGGPRRRRAGRGPR